MLGRVLTLGGPAPGLCLVLSLIAAPAAADPDPTAGAAPGELDRVFAQYHRSERAPVLLIVDGAEVDGDGPLLLELGRPDRPPVVPAGPVLAALAPRLAGEARAALAAAVRDHRLSLDALRATGLTATFDPQRLELRIDVPPQLTRTLSHDFGAGAPAAAATALGPSDASGYVNLHAGGTTDRRLFLRTDAAANIDGWVLEGRGDLAVNAPGADAPVTGHRGDVLLSRDVPHDAIRYMAGDFAIAPAGLQAGYPIAGIGAGRNFALRPYRVVRPIGTFEFVLERASRVTVLVNGAAVQTLSLAAGRHDVHDLPLGAGLNEIELLIRDDTGAERRIAFSLASPDELLAPGVTQFSLDAGFPLRSDVGLRRYDVAHPVLSGRYRQGATSWLTLGASFDGDLAHQIGGAGATLATSLGNLSLDAAASRSAPGDGRAAGVRYDHSGASRGGVTAFTIAGHYYSPRFRTSGPEASVGHYRGDVAIAAAGKLPHALLARIDLRYELGRDVRDAQSGSLGLSRSFGGVGLDASVSVLHHVTVRDEARLLVTARVALPGGAGAVHTASRASTRGGISNELGLAGHTGAPAAAVAGTMTLSQDPTSIGAGGTLDYTGSRLTSSLAGSTMFNLTGRGATDTASLDAGSALVFAGGRFAWSRPITGSFAIVDRHEVLDGVRIGVNPMRGGYAAETNALGPAVIPNLEAYRVSRIVVDAPELPAGYSLGPASYAILPAYRSGTLIAVGEAGTVLVRGTLLHYSGDAVSFTVAELSSLDDPRRPPVSLMTNGAGRFSVAGLQPGRYALRISGDAAASGEIEIPRGTTGLYAARIVEIK
ncbi:MAG TPA: fimbria/pilus outer membrane usher protein [Kofleriaceae bacterium]|jgi:outer membrane usher protein